MGRSISTGAIIHPALRDTILEEKEKNKTNQSGTAGEIYGPFNYLDKVVDFSDLEKELYNKYYNEYTSGYQAYNPAKRDISELLAAFEQEANSARNTALNTYNTTLSNLESDYTTKKADYERSYNTQREDLLNSLKRYQQQFEEDKQSQRRDFLTNQAALESAREQANRSVRNSMAARGLGGSGLQQLAMLQNVLGQSSDVSNLANENQRVTDKLRTLMSQYQEDHDTNITRLNEEKEVNLQNLADILNRGKNTALTSYNDLLSNISSNLTTNKANAINARDAEYTNALNDARRMAAQYNYEAQQNAGSRAEQAVIAYNTTTSSLAATLSDLSKIYNATDLKRYADEVGVTNKKGENYSYKEINKMDSKERQALRQLIANAYVKNADAALTDYALTYKAPSLFTKTSENNINYILQTYGFNPYYVTK